MEELKLYVITKSSSDGSFKSGDLVWLSKNGDLNSSLGKGWLEKDEWNQPGSNDFEFEISKTHVLHIEKGRESVIKL